MSTTFYLRLMFFVLGLFPFLAKAASMTLESATLLSINSAITPATYDYLRHQLKTAPARSLIIIQMNTPGGLVTTTKEIISLIGSDPRPVAVWVGPEGASASSAGAIIASSAHFIFMAPGSNMGAATPVGLGEDIKESDGRKKALNDLNALVRSQSQLRNRPSAPFEKMISEAESYTDKEALKLGIINGIVSSPQEILAMVNGKSVVVKGAVTDIVSKDSLPVHEKAATLGQRLLEVLVNPSTAYFLFLIGVALIYFEFQAPGGYIAGSVGLCFLIVAAIAFQVLPLDWGSLGLILVGIFLLILEVFITSYGLLSVAGLASFVAGSLFLFHGDEGYISIEYPVMFSTLGGVAAAVALLVWYLIREERKQKPVTSFFLPVGSRGVVMNPFKGNFFQIKVKGEIWKAQSAEPLMSGEEVEVTSVNESELKIIVKKAVNS